MSKTGNDSNNGQTANTAFLTVERMIDELYRWVADGYDITVNIGEGTYNSTEPLAPSYAYGGNVYWEGDYTKYTSNMSTSNIDASATSSGGNLEYIDFDLHLPSGADVDTDDHIIVKSATGGTNPELLLGCHAVQTWNGTGNIATLRVFRRDGVTKLPSGSITVNEATVLRTTLDFTGAGIKVSGAYHSGTWNYMTLRGDPGAYGVWMLNGAAITLGGDMGIISFDTGLYAQNNSSIFADGAVISKCWEWGVIANNGGVISLRYGAIVSGCATGGMKIFNGANVNCYQLYILCYGSSYGVYSYKGGFVDIQSGVLSGYHSSTPYGLYVASGGGIDSTSITADNPVVRGTASSPAGNGAYHAY